MRIGDVSRRRRFADPVRMRWYAHYRCVRFSRRMMCGAPPLLMQRREAGYKTAQ